MTPPKYAHVHFRQNAEMTILGPYEVIEVSEGSHAFRRSFDGDYIYKLCGRIELVETPQLIEVGDVVRDAKGREVHIVSTCGGEDGKWIVGVVRTHHSPPMDAVRFYNPSGVERYFAGSANLVLPLTKRLALIGLDGKEVKP